VFLSLCYTALRWVLQLATLRLRSNDCQALEIVVLGLENRQPSNETLRGQWLAEDWDQNDAICIPGLKRFSRDVTSSERRGRRL
jgi:hypothetical protein